MRELAREGLLIDVLPANDPHNVRARILRHGLTVSAFSSLEKYLENRFETVVAELPNCGLKFVDFSADLKRLLSIDAILGLANKVNLKDKAERQSFIEEKLDQLSKYSAVPAEYTVLGFSPRGSNVAESDVSGFLAAFGVEQPWSKLGAVTEMIGANRLNLKGDFIAMSKARHRSAHNPDSNVPSADLESHLENAVIIAISVDIICRSIKKALRQLPKMSELTVRLKSWPYRIRFVDQEYGGTWVERAGRDTQVIKRYNSRDEAVQVAGSRKKVDIVVVRDTAKIPVFAV
jgi:hypothetical protein